MTGIKSIHPLIDAQNGVLQLQADRSSAGKESRSPSVASHRHFVREAAHYRRVGWADLAADYLTQAAQCRLAMQTQGAAS